MGPTAGLEVSEEEKDLMPNRESNNFISVVYHKRTETYLCSKIPVSRMNVYFKVLFATKGKDSLVRLLT